jgi:hypothetical protein
MDARTCGCPATVYCFRQCSIGSMRNPMRHSSGGTRGTFIGALVAVCATLFGQESPRLEATRSKDGYLVRYQDPDFDNKWMELFVRDATRLNARIVATITRDGRDTWRYDYAATNGGESDQQLAWWQTQVQVGSQILVSPLAGIATCRPTAYRCSRRRPVEATRCRRGPRRPAGRL